ncbi:MAG TPA: regulatory protein RecX [Gemmatimonadaceae bacterium]|nr:regulatory protein RecX [Gemmatimonadaceae bacterium]
MTTITTLREHPRKPGRYELELATPAPDQHPSSVIRPAKLTVGIDLIAELKLKPGRQLSDGELARLEAGAQLLACYDKALATLGARARSAADLRRYLKTKDFTDEQITPTIEKLTALGLLNDLEYARTFARARMNPSRGLGPRRIAAELARKGVARAIADQVLGELADERAEQAEAAAERGEVTRSSAEEAAAKKIRSLKGLEPEVQKRRLYGFLARRGFSGAEISKAMRLLREG